MSNIDKLENQLGPLDVYKFVGAKVEMSFTSGERGTRDYLEYDATFEIAPSTTPVKKLTADEKEEYKSNFGM